LSDDELYTIGAFDNFVKAAPRPSQLAAADAAGSLYSSDGGDGLYAELPNFF
jgi:hypothetical protein